jgi:plasmid stabilization system protein ParE
MMRRVVVRQEAEADILGAAAWYERQAAGLGGAFLDDVHAAIARVIDNPLAHRRLRRRPEVRRVLTARFPYRVFFA